MTTHQTLLDATPILSETEKVTSPGRMLVILALVIFLAEILAMIVLYYLPLPNYFWTTLLDGLMMVLFILPGLYYLQLKPLVIQIRERDRIDAALRSNQALLRKGLELQEKFFSSITTLIAYMDRDFNFIRVNESYAQSAGHLPEYFTGKNHFDLYPNEDNQAIFQRVVDSGEPFSVRAKPFQNPEFPEQGVSYWDWGLQAVRGEDGQVEGLVLSLVDVTERKRAENTLARQHEQLLSLYQSESNARQFAEVLCNVSQSLAESLDLDHVLHTLLEHMAKILPAELAFVTLLEGDAHLAVRAVWRASGDGLSHMAEGSSLAPLNQITDSVLRRVKMTRQSVVVPAIPARAPGEPLPELEAIRSWLIVPIVAGQNMIGVVEVGQSVREEYTAEEISRAEAFCAQAAVAIQNAWLFEQTRASSERLQLLANKLVEVQETEREHIARELHDEAGQSLSSLKLGLGRLALAQDCPDSIRQQLQRMKGVADRVLEDLHRLALDLRPVALDHLGLVAALQQYIHQIDHEQLAVRFKAIGLEETRLPKEVETSIYRIVQEAVTNAIRHAQARQIGILIEHGETLKVFIEDDGIGFEPERVDLTSHMGLSGIRERAEMLGGHLTIESTPGIGTSIIVEVPDVQANPYR